MSQLEHFKILFKCSLESCFQRTEKLETEPCGMPVSWYCSTASLCWLSSLQPGFLVHLPALHTLKPVRLRVVRRDTAVTERLTEGG